MVWLDCVHVLGQRSSVDGKHAIPDRRKRDVTGKVDQVLGEVRDEYGVGAGGPIINREADWGVGYRGAGGHPDAVAQTQPAVDQPHAQVAVFARVADLRKCVVKLLLGVGRDELVAIA